MRTSVTHPLNVAYLVVGLVFLGIAGSWALQAADVVDAGDVGWMLPAVLVAAGLIGLVAMAARGVSRRRGQSGGESGGGSRTEDAGYSYDAPDAYEPPTQDLGGPEGR
jgi:hypothetical protein